MKQLLSLFLFLVPCLALAQYPTNGNQKITLGEQTSADGLIYRGVIGDTALITPLNDTSAYIILDTVNNRFFHYKRNTNIWSIAGGSDTSLIAYVNTYGTQTVNGEKTFVDNLKLSGTGNKTFIIESTGSGFPLIQIKGINPVAWNLENGRSTANLFGIYQSGGTGGGTIWFSIAEGGAASFANTLSVSAAATFLSTVSTQALTATSLTASGSGNSNIRATSTGNFPLFQLVDSRSGGSTWNIEGGRTLANLQIRHNTGQIAELTPSAQFGIGVASPTSVLHLKAGTATASTAPLKFTSGTNLTTAEAGAMEFNGTNLFFSPSTTRHTVNHGLTGSATLNFPSTLTMLSADLTITVTGAADGDVVSLGVPNAAVNANTSYSAWVSAANTVTVRFNNYSAGTVDPSSGSFKVFVTK